MTKDGGGARDNSHARPPFRRTIFLLVAFLGIMILTALGVWQVHRLVWKLNLIDQVENRIHAPPVAAPKPDEWNAVTADKDAYRRISVRGVFLNNQETLVQASTVRGPGYWVITPLQTDEGFVVLVNRGFVPPEARDPSNRAPGQIRGETVVTGLMRMTEPKGRFLRANDPASGHWYSRDVQAIAAADGQSKVAPYFVDADDTPNAGGFPIGGLTVVAFTNNHLVYALTWFGLAFMLAGAIVVVARKERQSSALRPL